LVEKHHLNKKGDYHVHCNYNDHSASDLTIQNVVKRGEEAGLETLAITEHVRRSSDWIPKYLRELEELKTRIEIIPGFEAKILRDGSIDCPAEYQDRFFLIASFHTTYGDKGIWTNALKTAIKNPSVDVIGHIAPEPTFTLSSEEIGELADLVIENDKIVELNVKYHRPPQDWLRIFEQKGVKFHLGSDAHSLPEIGKFDTIDDLIAIAEGRDQL
jgi:histidinol phosphatase-like PHP family hydrolase